jgi:hypothetical protein
VPRPPVRTLLLLIATIALGLASRRFPEWQPAFVARYAGDALWAAMVFWLLALVRPRAAARRLGFAALGIAFAVEASQLYHAPWLDAIRDTRLGALALGQGFLWSDLVCYAVGVAVAVAIDVVALRADSTR